MSVENKNDALKHKFTEVYFKNSFKGKESVSGIGSGGEQTEVLRKELPKLFSKLNIKSVLDAPCGDFFWMSRIIGSDINYTGVDIVGEMIKANNERFGGINRKFIEMDLSKEVPLYADLVICRDLLVHLSYEDAFKVLRNIIKSKSEYILTTTFTERNDNMDLGSGFWRVLNLNKAPFNFPEARMILNENCTEADKKFTDKSLGLWKSEDLRF